MALPERPTCATISLASWPFLCRADAGVAPALDGTKSRYRRYRGRLVGRSGWTFSEVAGCKLQDPETDVIRNPICRRSGPAGPSVPVDSVDPLLPPDFTSMEAADNSTDWFRMDVLARGDCYHRSWEDAKPVSPTVFWYSSDRDQAMVCLRRRVASPTENSGESGLAWSDHESG